MSETPAIVDALKTVLRREAITYVDIGERLGLSESSVKRLFSKREFSLKRLDQICELAGVQISDLIREADDARIRIDQLEEDVEQSLVENPKLFLVAYCVVNYWTFEEILGYYDFEEPELIGMFTRLDRLKVIELLPGNRARLLVSKSFTWRPGGPIEKFFQAQIQGQFLASRFRKSDELRLVVNGMLTPASRSSLIDRLQRVAQSFEQASTSDRGAPLEERRSTTLLIAMRPWLFDAFTEFERTNAALSPAADHRANASQD